MSAPVAASGREPVIIGVADIVNRTSTPHEPLKLISDAVNEALHDACSATSASSTALQSAVDELVIVKPWTWTYDDLPELVAERTGLGASAGSLSTRITGHGGNNPVKALDEACRRIVAGAEGVSVLAGGEALSTLAACAKAGRMPPPGWTSSSTETLDVFSPTTAELPQHTLGSKHGIGTPVQIYPLYENGLRAHIGQSREANHAESARLYADFAQVAAGNKYAWSFGREPETVDSIAKVGKSNRMICYPYPLLMNAFNNVNLAAAVVVTSVATAEKLGIPKDKCVYVLGGAGTNESGDFWRRSTFHHSPAISASLDTALSASGLTTPDVHLVDFYSCFPIVPKLAARHLGLPLDGKLTLLGGLTSFGGAGNNYSMHALTEMTRRLRKARIDGPAPTHGLILANGGVLSYQHAAVLSSAPRRDGRAYPAKSLLPEFVDAPSPVIVEHREPVEGDAVVETFTVDFSRDGTPLRGHIVGRLADGRRFLANNEDMKTLHELVREDAAEPIGRKGRVKTNPTTGTNKFSFTDVGENSKL